MNKTKKTNRTKKINEIPVNLKNSKVKIAFAQMASPLPDGKVVGVLPMRARETYVWSNYEEIKKRKAKALKILEFLNKHHPDTELIIFPEYSLPVVQEDVREMLQHFSNKHEVIIVGGADNIPSGAKNIYNKCPIFIPQTEEPKWVVKQNLSQWENRYIDEQKSGLYQNPVFSWKVNNQKHYISIHVCLDFTFVMRSQLFDDNAPVIRIVPMCSPDMNLLRGYADLTLTETGGRAVILCNCIGKGSVGKSSIFLVSPEGAALKPAFEYEENQEGIVYFEIDCSRLILPRKSTIHTRNALEKVHPYKILTVSDKPDEIEIHSLSRKPPATSRAIINPAIFKRYDKKMRVAFIGVDAYGSLNESDMAKPGFECYSILGHSDMMITHLHTSSTAMLFDIINTIPGFKSSDNGDFSRFPFFEVSTFHKVLGVKVTNEHRRAFDGKNLAPQELDELLRLGINWNAPGIDEKTKDIFRRDGWVLGYTTEEPGNIDAVMTIYINDPDNLDKSLNDFENRVLPQLIEKSHITSIYEVDGHRMSIHYLLRIKSSIKQLFSFISEVHAVAALDKFPIKTNTFVIVKKWGSLDLKKTLSHDIPAVVEAYIKSDMAPFLEKNDLEKLESLSKEEQQKVVEEHRNLKTSFRFLERKTFFDNADRIKQMNESLTVGMAKQDLRLLALPHDELQGRVETLLRDLVDKIVTPEYLDQIRDIVNVPKGKTKDVLTYAELLKIAMQAIKDNLLDPAMLEDLQNLFAKTKDVRNAVKHSDFTRLTIDGMIQALNQYCAFLIKWDAEQNLN